MVKNPPANAGDAGDVDLIPGLGRSPGGGHGNPLQYSCLEHPIVGGAWPATVDSVAELNTTEATWHTRKPIFSSMSAITSHLFQLVSLLPLCSPLPCFIFSLCLTVLDNYLLWICCLSRSSRMKVSQGRNLFC